MLRDLFSLFPAYAGVILLDAQNRRSGSPFPRICGGDPYETEEIDFIKPFSPHMRG